ncbi:MAG: serine/threonine-protein kinase [Longimonas sp.]|uniref:tetratricopeptide repeat protein n=1 Tax=Longimonas sp. TaxID=2039626 RepID=UPI003975DEC3
MSIEHIDTEQWTRAMELLDLVLQRPCEERASFLNEVCNDPDLRAEVEAMLRASEQTIDFLDQGGAAATRSLLGDETLSNVVLPHEDKADSYVGPYRLIERIGTGGMSVVYRAERADGHYKQHVAIKLLPRYFETDHRVARFQAERQILARLNHPNIARLLDGGLTEAGHPYLVMEYVDGVPLTDYCAAHECSLKGRLKLLRTVCEALQHAHQNLVVHRDLKPDNILVTESGTVKLLDFGIAKLIHPTPHDTSQALTRTGECPMTPAYAAPEQIKGGTITTATDIYQLGVLAYHILTGTHPFRNSDTSVQEAILDTAPPPPSSAVRSASEPPTWTDDPGTSLTTDLDTVVLKALRREPTRRYRSAQEFAADLTRYLNDHPVQARPVTWWYRMRKFVQRNRSAVMAAAGGVLLFVGLSLFHVHRLSTERTTAERHAETAEAVTSFMVDLIEMGDPAEARGGAITPRDLLNHGLARVEHIDGQPEVEAQVRLALGRVYRRVGEYDDARPLIERALELQSRHLPLNHPERAEGLKQKGALLAANDDFEEAEAALRQSLGIWNQLGDARLLDRARTQHRLAYVLRRQGEYDQALALHRDNVQLRRTALGPNHPETLESVKRAGLTLHNLGDYAAAEERYRQAIRGQRAALETPHPQLAMSLSSLGALYMNQGRFQAAKELLDEALQMRREIYGTEHETVALTLNNLAMAVRDQGDFQEADSLFQKTLSVRRALHENPHTGTAMTLREMGMLYLYTNRVPEARTAFQEALRIFKTTLDSDHSFVVRTQIDLGYARSTLRDEAVSQSRIDDAFQTVQDIHPDSSLERGLANVHYGALIAQQQEGAAQSDSLLQAGTTILASLDGSDSLYTPSQRLQYARDVQRTTPRIAQTHSQP